MSGLICPFCGEKLQQTYSFNPTQFWCSNYYDHKHPINLQGTKELWQELINTKELLEIECAEHSMCHTQMLKTTEKLERTRKALDVAVDALREICAGVPSDKWVFDTANKAINESTKKDVK